MAQNPQALGHPPPNWATSLGLRWEGIETKSDSAAAAVDNRSTVLNPLAHVVWRFDAPRRDQVRASLTQSYRSPPTQSLVARPRLNTLYPAPGPNTAISADFAGNPQLKPELANGLVKPPPGFTDAVAGLLKGVEPFLSQP